MFSGAGSSSSAGAGSSSSSGGGDFSAEGEADQIRGLKRVIGFYREQLNRANEDLRRQQETTRLILDNMNLGDEGGAVDALRVRIQELESRIENLQTELASREGLLNETMDEQSKLQNSVDLWKKRAKSLEEALDLDGIDWEQEEEWKKILDKIKKMKETGEGVREFVERLGLNKKDDKLDLEEDVVPLPVVKTMEPPILLSTGQGSLPANLDISTAPNSSVVPSPTTSSPEPPVLTPEKSPSPSTSNGQSPPFPSLDGPYPGNNEKASETSTSGSAAASNFVEELTSTQPARPTFSASWPVPSTSAFGRMELFPNNSPPAQPEVNGGLGRPGRKRRGTLPNDVPSRQVPKRSDVEKFKCPDPKCRSVFVSLDTLKVHLRKNHWNTTLLDYEDGCAICQKAFRTKLDLSRHVLTVHGSSSNNPFIIQDSNSISLIVSGVNLGNSSNEA